MSQLTELAERLDHPVLAVLCCALLCCAVHSAATRRDISATSASLASVGRRQSKTKPMTTVRRAGREEKEADKGSNSQQQRTVHLQQEEGG